MIWYPLRLVLVRQPKGDFANLIPLEPLIILCRLLDTNDLLDECLEEVDIGAQEPDRGGKICLDRTSAKHQADTETSAWELEGGMRGSNSLLAVHNLSRQL